jgi:flagellar hook-associated protein 3 FlgL
MTVSTLSLMRSSYLSVTDNQKRLADAQVELSTGRLANIGTTLGVRTSLSIDLRTATDRNSLQLDLNGLASNELQATQNGLSSLIDLAHNFSAILIGARNALNGQQIVKDAAKSAIASLQNVLNSTHDGKALFAGINTSTPPLSDYLNNTPTTAKSAVDSVFLAEFGTTQNGSAVSTITSTQMDTFLNGNFANLFNQANWSANWSAANSQNQTIRINDNFRVEASASANDPAFRNLTMALTMAFDLGSGSLNQVAFERLVDKATTVASSAASDLGNVSSKLGITQKLLSEENTRLTERSNILNQELGQLEGVDQYEVSTRINTLTTQLEASYSITARINKLSLLNYL